MSDQHDVDGHRVKRFKHQSYNEQLKSVHLQAPWEQGGQDLEVEENDSQFHEAIQRWMQLNLSPSFLRFAHRVIPLCQSFPLLLHHWREIVDLWLSACAEADDESLKALFSVLQDFCEDLRLTLLPVYSELFQVLCPSFSRSPSPETLTVLLSTCSSLFKNILIPSLASSEEQLEENLLLSTWNKLEGTLKKCKYEVQRAIAEVWALVLRRLKQPFREHAVQMLISSLEDAEVQDAAAWIFVFSTKSVAQSLHTCTRSVFQLLMNEYLLRPTEYPIMEKLIRRTLTALVHHCLKAENFTEVCDMLVDQLSKDVEEITRNTLQDFQNEERLSKILGILSIPGTVRKGVCISQKQLFNILNLLLKIPITTKTEVSVMKVIICTLNSSNSGLSVWMSAGRIIIDYAWSSNRLFAIRLSGSLLSLEWSGFKQFVLPHVVKYAQISLRSDSKEERVAVLHLISQVSKAGMLNEAHRAWKMDLSKWAANEATQYQLSESSALELRAILNLLSLSPGRDSHDCVKSMVTSLISLTRDTKADYEETWANKAWAIGECFYYLAEANGIRLDEVDVRMWINQSVTQWYWSESVMKALASLARKHLHSDGSSESVDDTILIQMKANLSSASQSLRLSSLTLLNAVLPSSAGCQELIQLCIAVEDVPLNVQGVRERIHKVERLNRAIPSDNELAVEILAFWYLGQFWVNLRPIWKSICEALSTLSQQFPSILWPLILQSLSQAISGVEADVGPLWSQLRSTSIVVPLEDEEERTWRDPNTLKLQVLLSKWIDSMIGRDEIIQEQAKPVRCDRATYESLILQTLEHCSSLAEKNSKDLVPIFLEFTSQSSTSKPSRQRLSIWLTLFSKFSNPKALFASSTVHAFCTGLLSHPDKELRQKALNVILTYKSPALKSRQEQLHALFDDTRWRDEIFILNIEDIEEGYRSELVPVLIRLLYGSILDRRGRGAKRATVLGVLGACRPEELEPLVDLMLEPFVDASGERKDFYATADTEKQQIGFLSLIGDVLKHFGTRLIRRWSDLLNATIAFTEHAQVMLEQHASGSPSEEEQVVVENEQEPEVADEDESFIGSLKRRRAIRQLGMKRFADFFRVAKPGDFDFTLYVSRAFTAFVTPRLSAFDKENTQAVTPLLDLLNVWTQSRQTALYLVNYDDTVLPKVYDCIMAPSVKPAVLSLVFDMTERLLSYSADDNQFFSTVVQPSLDHLLEKLSLSIEVNVKNSVFIDQLGRRQIDILSEIASYCHNGDQAATLIRLFLPLLRKPMRTFPDKVKMGMIKIIGSLLHLIPDIADSGAALISPLLDCFGYLFQNLSGQPRRLVVETFKQLSNLNTDLGPTAFLIVELNAYSKKRIEEADFERRLSAFASFNEESYLKTRVEDWPIILSNMLYFIRDEDELSIRNSASASIKRFIDLVSSNTDSVYLTCFNRTLYTGLKRWLKSDNDLVRSEVLGVISYAVAKTVAVESLREMSILLANGDEEANFFNNILHIQNHRRIRALHRLADFCNQVNFRNSTLTDIFIPLVTPFINTSPSTDHHLVNEAITTLSAISKHLSWSAYNDLVRRYLKSITDNKGKERVFVRTLTAILDSFHFSMEHIPDQIQTELTAEKQPTEEEKQDQAQGNRSRVADVVNNRLLPDLLERLNKRGDDVEDSNRIPIAIGIAKIISFIPAATRELQATRLLTVLSQMLRSKSQETRDLARDTICRVLGTLGNSYLPILLTEMRTALIRGPQLHVLAYVAHTILVSVTTESPSTDLDASVSSLVHVSAEVIFGQSGKDTQNEEYKTKMKEVRGSTSRGMDSFNILAKHISPGVTTSLLLPLKAIMQETESVKVMTQVEELLRRIAKGIASNPRFGPPEVLSLSYTLISQNSKFLKESVRYRERKGKRGRDVAIVQNKRQLEVPEDHYAHNSHRFISFGLDLFNTTYRRNQLDLQDRKTIARLEPLVAAIGNTLYSTEGSVVTSGLKAMVNITKCPLKAIEPSMPVFVRQTLDIIKQTGSTDSELVQTALKSLATVIRDCPSAKVKEKDLTFLLEVLTPDLEEPERQSAAFSILRAIVSRKFVVPEIYDLMHKVSEILITSQSTQVQELSRSVVLQFLLDYPQGQGRLKQHMAFLAKNLSYEFESGRISVMELLNAVISKFQDDLVQGFSDMLFVALVMVLANDDSAKCRENSAQLLKNLITRLNETQRRLIISHAHSWATQGANEVLMKVSCQVYGIIMDTLGQDAAAFLSGVLLDLDGCLKFGAKDLTDDERDSDSMDIDKSWHIPYQALVVTRKAFAIFPDSLKKYDSISWPSIIALLLHPHTWVRSAACQLLGAFFGTTTTISPPDAKLPDAHPMSASAMQSTTKALCMQLRSTHLTSAFAVQVVKNLFFVGKCFYAGNPDGKNAAKYSGGNEDDDGDEEGDDDVAAGDDEPQTANLKAHADLRWLFSRLSYQARSAQIARRTRRAGQGKWPEQPLSILQWFAAMVNHMKPEDVETFLPHVLSPVYRILDDETIRESDSEGLKAFATELQDLVQTKVGTTKFTNAYSQIRQSVLNTRRERRTAKAVEATTNPQLAAKRKMKHNLIKKESRKRKNQNFAHGRAKSSFSRRND